MRREYPRRRQRLSGRQDFGGYLAHLKGRRAGCENFRRDLADVEVAAIDGFTEREC
jgi:hypothetical protein